MLQIAKLTFKHIYSCQFVPIHRRECTPTSIIIVPTFFYERLLKDERATADVGCTTTGKSKKRKHGSISHYIKGEPGDLSLILIPINVSNTHWILCVRFYSITFIIETLKTAQLYRQLISVSKLSHATTPLAILSMSLPANDLGELTTT